VKRIIWALYFAYVSLNWIKLLYDRTTGSCEFGNGSSNSIKGESQTGYCSGNTLDLRSRGARFESRLNKSYPEDFHGFSQ
jgi:hypothetical protein